ncbi:MAG TPA: hypothetical protein VK923_19235 [Euzebyales bacterium]|nr:hypothetical protein [Euzebyales bacterium]
MSDPGVTADRWHRRPGLARAYRVYAMVGPLLALFSVAYFAADLLPPAGGPVTEVLRGALIAGVALAGALAVERTLRRLLPVAALLDLDLGFPGAVPRRSRIASLASLRGGDAELADLLPGMADRDLDAAAEHVIISYAATARSGLRPRSHAGRVRAVATLVAERLHLDRDDLDRFQWALLLRELGTGPDDLPHPHQPMVAWLGPWSALLRGPFIDVATTSTTSSVAIAAHAAAVADAYVVVTAAHPYERSLDGGSPLPLEALAAERLSPIAVESLLRLSVPVRRRAAGFTSGVPSRLVRYSPTPQPVFALASLLAVLAFVAGGVGTAQTTLPAQVAAAEDPGSDAGTGPDTLSFPPAGGRTLMVEAARKEPAPSRNRKDRMARASADDSTVRPPWRVASLLPGERATASSYPGLSAMRSTASGGSDTVSARGGGSARSSASSGSAGTPSSKPTSSPEPRPRPKADPAPAPDSDPTPAPDPDPGPAPAPDPDPAPTPDPDPAPTPDRDPAPAPDPDPGPDVEPAP